jgi:hypothetical protein
MKTRILKRSILLNSPLEMVFDFFSRAENLDLLTPVQLKFKILSPLPIDMKVGTLIDYQISLFQIPFKWRTKITDWIPNQSFTDSQVKGPYLKWIHTHSFEKTEQGVWMHDTVEYASPGWFLEPLLHELFIKKQLDDIFNYRNAKCKQIFG